MSPYAISLRTVLTVTASICVVLGLVSHYGVSTGVMGAAIFAFALMMAWSSQGDPQDLARLLTPLILLLTFGGYTMDFFVDYATWLLGCSLVVLACGPFLAIRNDRVSWYMLVGCSIWLAVVTIAHSQFEPNAPVVEWKF